MRTPPRGSNLLRVGDYNQRVVVDVIRRSTSGVSRIEIARLTGLSAQTVTNVVRRLLQAGLVSETGRHNVGPGKPRILLGLAPGGGHAVGVHLDPVLITTSLCDLSGRVVRVREDPIDPATPPERVVQLISDQVRSLTTEATTRPLGIGVAAPGPVDGDRGRLIAPPLLPGWHDVDLGPMIERSTGLPTLLAKDSAAACVGEMWGRAEADEPSFVFCYLGAGIGLGAVVEGQPQGGVTANFGEMGRLVTQGAGGSETIGDHYARLVRGAVPPAAGGPSSGTEAGVDELAERIGQSMALLTDLLDIDEVVFGGPCWERFSAAFLARVPRVLRRDCELGVVRPVALRGSRHGTHTGTIGAAALVLTAALSPHHSSLLLD